MKIKLVNHACVIIENDKIKLICDPWLEGRVFDNGWDLIVPSAFDYSDFQHITHIWFSHEHPDHFFPPNIKKINPTHRKKITVLFQETMDHRVVNYIKKLGFKEVIEMKPEQWIPLDSDIKVMCENYTEGDSWLAIQSKETTVLNTNDCEVNNEHDVKAILKKIGGKVDVLLAQFSYACWAGNKEQTELRKSIAKSKLDIFLLQIKSFQPKTSIPIASYVWFCHQDNFYLNDLVNKPDLVESRIKNETNSNPIVLFPGDTYQLGQEHSNDLTINKWLKAYNDIKKMDWNNLEKSNSVDLEELLAESKIFTKKLKEDFGLVANLLKPSRIHLNDYDKSFTLSLRQGLLEQSIPIKDCDISLSSDSLMTCMKLPWGNDTLGVNGKFTKPLNGDYSRFYNFFRYNQLKSRGIDVNLSYLLNVAFRKFTHNKSKLNFYV